MHSGAMKDDIKLYVKVVSGAFDALGIPHTWSLVKTYKGRRIATSNSMPIAADNKQGLYPTVRLIINDEVPEIIFADHKIVCNNRTHAITSMAALIGMNNKQTVIVAEDVTEKKDSYWVV